MLTPAQWQARKRLMVDRHSTPTNFRGSLQFISVIAPIAALWYAVHQAPAGSLWTVAAATAGLSLFLLRGFVLMHDCGHNSLFRSRSLNRIGGFLLGVLAGLPQQVWAENHRFHHTTNGNWARYRGPLNITSVADYLAMGERERRRYRRTRSILMSPVAGFLYFLVNPRLNWLRASYHLLRRRLARTVDPDAQAALPLPYCASMAHYRHMLWNNLLLLAIWAAMVWTMGRWPFFVCYVVSGSLAGACGIILFAVQHNFRHSYASADEGWDRDEAALRGTSFLVLPRWLNWITADAAYHHVHHLCAGIPNYRLAACHREHALLFSGVSRVGLFEVPSALMYVLWDMQARRLVSVAEVMAPGDARASSATG